MSFGTFNIAPPKKIEPQGLIVTDTGAKWILELLAAEGKSPEQWALRIAVLGGGCSGYMYDIKWDEPKDDDAIFSHENGARVCVDPKSLAVVDGSRVEYFARLQGAGFAVVNPNATSSCGCGESFSV